MKYLYLFLLVAGLNSQVPAQSKFSLGYVYSTELSSINKYYLGKPGFRIGYTTGISARYHFNKKLSLTSGLQYSLKGFSNSIIFTDANNNALGTEQVTFSYRFIEVPLLLSYQCQSDSKASLYSSIGLVSGYFSSAKIYGGQFAGAQVFSRSDLNNGYNKFILSAYLGIGVMIKLSDKFFLLVQPNFKYSLTRLNKPGELSGPNNLQLNLHPYSIGLLSGVYYQF